MIYNQKSLEKKGKGSYSVESKPFLFNSTRTHTYFGTCHFYPISFQGHSFYTSEQLYQYLAFKDYPQLRLEIMTRDKGLDAKQLGVYYHEYKIPDFWKYRLDIFLYTLILKVEQNEDFKEKLISTGDKKLVEYDFWGGNSIFAAQFDEDTNAYVGYNFHGRMLMVIREKIKNGSFNDWAKMVKATIEKDYINAK